MSNQNTATSVAQNETQEQLVARLLAENAALKANQKPAARGDIGIGNDLSIMVSIGGRVDKKTGKVSKGGGVSVYGIHSRFPVTMYAEQWLRLLASADAIKSFIDANKSKFPPKPVK